MDGIFRRHADGVLRPVTLAEAEERVAIILARLDAAPAPEVARPLVGELHRFGLRRLAAARWRSLVAQFVRPVPP